MRVVLIQIPFPVLPEEPRHLSPPLGLAYMAATLLGAGCEVDILDSVLEGYDQEWEFGEGSRAYGLKPEIIASRLADRSPDIVGLSCLFSTQDEILRQVAAAIRDRLPDSLLVLGGTHPTVFAKSMVSSGQADFVIRGEGEYAIVSLAQAVAGKGSYCAVPGLVWMEQAQIRENPLSRIDPLENLPLPARHCLDLGAYSSVGIMHGESRRDVPATTIVSSRGCPARCTFCSIHPVWGHQFRTTSTDRVLSEISELYHRYGIRHLLIEDDNFTFDLKHAKQILSEMARVFPDLTWSAPNGVAIWRLDEEIIQLMTQTGCQRLSLAVESGCQDTLARIIDKPLSLQQVNEVVRLCRKHGLKTTAFFVLGMPGETPAAMVESMDFAARLDVDTLTVMMAVPLPGSPLYEIASQGGLIAPETPFETFTTRNPVMISDDYDPMWVDRLARRTMLRHALRHPVAYVVRSLEKFRVDPASTMKAVTKVFLSSLRPGGAN